MNDQPPRERDPVPRFIGWFMIAVGLLWITLSGICTITMLAQTDTDPNSHGLNMLFAGVGVISAVIGFAIFMLGRWLARN